MGIREALTIVNDMEAAGVICRFTIAGAVAAFNYIEPAVTEDVDVLVSFESSPTERRSGLVTLGPILTYLAKRGFDRFERKGILIAGWPVQFLPVASDLDEEALIEAEEFELPGQPSIKMRSIGAEHLVAMALKAGRPKDWTRIAAFLQAGVLDLDKLDRIIARHGLTSEWRNARIAFGNVWPEHGRESDVD